jgi:signal peptidase I
MAAKRILKTSAELVLVSFLLAAFVALLAVGVGPRTGRYRTMTVLSNSMRPTYPTGSVVFVKPIKRSEVKVGDAITYRIPVEDRRIVTHRVVEIVQPGESPVVRTRGDGVSQPDPWLAELKTDPAWKVFAGVPYLGYILHALRTSALRQLLLYGVPVLLSLVWLADIWRGASGEAENDETPAVDHAHPERHWRPGATRRRVVLEALLSPFSLLRRPPGQHWA